MFGLDLEFRILDNTIYTRLSDNAIILGDGYNFVVAYFDTRVLNIIKADRIMRGFLTYSPQFQEFLDRTMQIGETTIQFILPLLRDGYISDKYNLYITTTIEALTKALEPLEITYQPLEHNEDNRITLSFYRLDGLKVHKMLKAIKNIHNEVEALTILFNHLGKRRLLYRLGYKYAIIKTRSVNIVNTPEIRATYNKRKKTLRVWDRNIIVADALSLLPSLKNQVECILD